MAALTASLITVNWGIYVWAIGAGRAVETALGYYINPLINVVMAAVLLDEKLSRPQIVAVALAALAVLILTIDVGGLPWISLSLALSFAIYGYLAQDLADRPEPGLLPRSADPVDPGGSLYRLAAGDAASVISCPRTPPTSDCCCSAAR